LNLDDAVIIETFRSRIEAEMAASWLEAEGIEVLILADDAGGAYPMLQFLRGVRLLVAPEDEARAKEVLQALEQGASDAPEENPDDADG
jgi:predicted Fe-Mo cluster-binding NifX family protein